MSFMMRWCIEIAYIVRVEVVISGKNRISNSNNGNNKDIHLKRPATNHLLDINKEVEVAVDIIKVVMVNVVVEVEFKVDGLKAV